MIVLWILVAYLIFLALVAVTEVWSFKISEAVKRRFARKDPYAYRHRIV